MRKATILCVLLIYMLSGCSTKKETVRKEETETETKEVRESAEKNSDDIIGTWRVCAVSYNDTRFTMDQIRALTDEFPDMIIVFAKDGSALAASSQDTQIRETSWEKGDEENTINIEDTILHLQDGELLIPDDEGSIIFFEKISDREDKDIFDELLKSTVKEENGTSEESKEEKEEEVQENKEASDGIRPEVREAIDAYESFVDRYIEFMGKYENSDGDLSILLDYAKFMEELNEYTDKMDALEDDLNDAEYAYYLEVLNRCNGKMIKALN